MCIKTHSVSSGLRSACMAGCRSWSPLPPVYYFSPIFHSSQSALGLGVRQATSTRGLLVMHSFIQRWSLTPPPSPQNVLPLPLLPHTPLLPCVLVPHCAVCTTTTTGRLPLPFSLLATGLDWDWQPTIST